MKLIRGLDDLADRHRGSAVTIGNFDGVHRGHQAVLASLVAQARALDAEPTVVTFEPLPREWFMGADAPPRLQSLRDKVAADAFGINKVGFYLSRQGALIDWPLKDFLTMLGADKPVTKLRQLLKADLQRAGRQCPDLPYASISDVRMCR
jgi:riboflavin kinase / FMN adenylyltransferase